MQRCHTYKIAVPSLDTFVLFPVKHLVFITVYTKFEDSVSFYDGKFIERNEISNIYYSKFDKDQTFISVCRMSY